MNGNIKYKHEYDYTTGTLPATPKKTIEYHYDDSSWSDVLTSVSETTYPTTNSSNTSTYSVMGGVLNAPSTDTTASDNLAKSLLGNNCKKVDITANGVLNVGDDDLATPNMNTYSMNSTTNSSTLFSMEVDAIGNMTKFNGYDFNWNGRRLESISQNGVELISYKYNIDGQRVSKTVGNTTTEYFYNGDILAGQKTGNDVLIFMYDNNGEVFGFEYNGTPYYYVKNAQNDVYMIVDETGVAYVLYMYDAWGRVACYDGTDFGLATINPLMYRSYYIDVETGYFFYYLNSRYYLADLGRFISADSYVQTGQGMLDKNMFAYCGNNPVNYVDPDGDCPYNGTAADFHRLEQGLPSLDCTCRDSERSEVLAYSEHQKKGTTNPSNRNKHENGQTRRQRDQNGEKKNQKPGWKPNPNKRNTQNMELVPVIVEKVVCTVVLVGAVSIAVYVVANDFTGIGVVDDPALAALTPVIWDSASRLLA